MVLGPRTPCTIAFKDASIRIIHVSMSWPSLASRSGSLPRNVKTPSLRAVRALYRTYVKAVHGPYACSRSDLHSTEYPYEEESFLLFKPLLFKPAAFAAVATATPLGWHRWLAVLGSVALSLLLPWISAAKRCLTISSFSAWHNAALRKS